MTMQFTDSNAANFELVKELVAGMPDSARVRCERAGMTIVNVVDRMRKDSPNDPAVALGAAFAIFYMAERLVQPSAGEAKSDGDKLILTL